MRIPISLLPGDVAELSFLHLESARHVGDHPIKPKHLLFEVEGKTRPVLICSTVGRERGQKWFSVRYFTTKPYTKNTISVGKLIDPNIDNFIHVEPHRYPENLFRSTIKRLDRLEFGGILKEVTNSQLRQNNS